MNDYIRKFVAAEQRAHQRPATLTDGDLKVLADYYDADTIHGFADARDRLAYDENRRKGLEARRDGTLQTRMITCDPEVAARQAQAHGETAPMVLKTIADVEQFFSAAGDTLPVSTLSRHFVKFAKAAIDQIRELRSQVDELQQRPVLAYRGVWCEDTQYNQGDFATSSGSLWHCNRSTRSRPGTDETWTLAAKRGRDARD